MKKIIVAIDNKKILNKIKEINNLKIISKNVQYREAILEILKKEKNINFIFIDEKLSGEVSIEDLINKIKKINKKINIIFFLEKEDIKKEKKLKKLGIKNIYSINKINSKEILNLLKENKFYKIKKIKENSKYSINNRSSKIIDINKKDNEIITIYGEPKLGKKTIINLFIIYLIENNKKILFVNLSKRAEEKYLIMLNKKYFKNKEINNIENQKIKINKNLTIINNFGKTFENLEEKNMEKKLNLLIKNFKQCYNCILFDVDYSSNIILEDKIIEESDKKIIVIDENLLGIQKMIKQINKMEKEKNGHNNDLHVIQDKYYFNSISHLILKNIFKNFCNIHKIFYKKNHKDLTQKNLKNQKIKINKSTKIIIEKILR